MLRSRRRCGVVFVMLALLAVVIACVTPHMIITTLGVAVLSGMAFLWTNGENRTLFSLLNQYVATRILIWLGKRQRRKLNEDTLDIQRVQWETLLKRLRKNADTLYGRQHQFSSIKDKDDFCRRIPLTTREHYTELLENTAAGVEKVLVTEKPVILTTSATSGSSNLVLSTKDTRAEFFFQGEAVCADVRRQTFTGTRSPQRILWLFPPSLVHQSGVGLPTGPSPFTFSITNHMLHLCTTPPPALRVQCEGDLLYLHLLFALKNLQIGVVESSSSSNVLYAFRTLQARWEELVDDVEFGRISTRLALDPGVRADLERLVKPDPGRAAELRVQLSQGFQGVARRLWPRLHLVVAMDSGPEQIYGELLRTLYCKGLPLYSPLYAGPEARNFLLCPRSMFCEFLPEESVDMEQFCTFLMDQVEQGHSYELVITNAAGLYRYRTGDIVKVVGFHNQSPVVEFLYRRGEMLNVRGEEVSEALFLSALKKAVAQWPGATLVDYCCAESGILEDSSGGAQPHYQVFLELKGVRNLTEEQRYKLDCSLQRDSAIYKSFRIKGSIGPMKVQLVSEGAIQELRGCMMAFWNISPNEFKMHRVIRYKGHADFLLGKTFS
ncbi:GH3 domain-containing protein isoform X2 [Electrophorus electricus]|uniref:GH3 domain-containing protein isoform X2 n=1 Tax=Electrophorus electricus TaxID=8005 RepID=UPI0015D0B303|nr:GH3 domain-containing protein isoform X2 [Electrophorus electricus]